jgi:hypothetical protein
LLRLNTALLLPVGLFGSPTLPDPLPLALLSFRSDDPVLSSNTSFRAWDFCIDPSPLDCVNPEILLSMELLRPRLNELSGGVPEGGAP